MVMLALFVVDCVDPSQRISIEFNMTLSLSRTDLYNDLYIHKDP